MWDFRRGRVGLVGFCVGLPPRSAGLLECRDGSSLHPFNQKCNFKPIEFACKCSWADLRAAQARRFASADLGWSLLLVSLNLDTNDLKPCDGNARGGLRSRVPIATGLPQNLVHQAVGWALLCAVLNKC